MVIYRRGKIGVPKTSRKRKKNKEYRSEMAIVESGKWRDRWSPMRRRKAMQLGIRNQRVARPLVSDLSRNTMYEAGVELHSAFWGIGETAGPRIAKEMVMIPR